MVARSSVIIEQRLTMQPRAYANYLNLRFLSCWAELALQQRVCKCMSQPSGISNRDRNANFPVFRIARQTCAMTSQLLIRNRPSDKQYFVKRRTTFAFKDITNHWVMQLTIRLAAGSVNHRCTKQQIHRSPLEVIFKFPTYTHRPWSDHITCSRVAWFSKQ